MPNTNATLCAATDALYATYEAIAGALRASGENPLNIDTRHAYMSAMHRLAVHVCDADGQLSGAEASTINDIFWLDQLGWDDWNVRDDLIASPGITEASLTVLEQYARLMAAFDTANTDHNIVLETTALVLGTVLAADANEDLEVERLSQITRRLRAAAFPDATATGAGGAPLPSPSTVTKPAGNDSVAAVLKELNGLVGLGSVKHQVETLTNLARVFAIRRRMGLAVPAMSFHLVFLGNPGTGKTTVARIIARLYGALGLLSKGQLVEVDRSGLVASYLGQTASKVDAVVQQALGGVLFIDEAYALAEGERSDAYGEEAVTTLVKAMEDHRADLVVIAAGYTEEMRKFLAMNPGLKSRMCRSLVFEDYTPAEMVAIFRSMAEQAQYRLPPACDALLGEVFGLMRNAGGKDFANARDVRNLFERVIDEQANRLGTTATPTEMDLTTITTEDLKAAAGPLSAMTKAA